jgi:hypothetical protein
VEWAGFGKNPELFIITKIGAGASFFCGAGASRSNDSVHHCECVRDEFVCLSFGDLERLKQERDKCLKQDETLICCCRFCDKTITQKKHNMESHACID